MSYIIRNKNSDNQSSFYLHAKKSLGQNFLKDKNFIIKILSSIQDTLHFYSCNYVHEIGPGSGAMTRPLLEAGIKVKALEKDERAVHGLNETLFKNFPNLLEVLHTDILKWQPLAENQVPICVGNIPYYITSDILLWFCKNKSVYLSGIFMLQNEVADRLKAKPHTKDYGRLSIKIQLMFDVEKLFIVPADCFVPIPKVDSAIILLKPKNFSFSCPKEESFFESFTSILFSARRKMIRKTISNYLEKLENNNKPDFISFWDKMAQYHIAEETRPDAISVEGFYAMHTIFWNSNNQKS